MPQALGFNVHLLATALLAIPYTHIVLDCKGVCKMALNVFGRLSRFLRATFVPAALVFSFSILLTFVFILYKPGFGPGGLQRVGWQAWEPVFDSSSAYSGGNSGVGAVDEEQTVGDDWDVDWWNVTKLEGGADTASLPLDIWHPLLQHDTGCAYIPNRREHD